MHRIRVNLLLMMVAATAPPLTAEDFFLYYLGGQSNMDGYVMVEQLPPELKGPLEGVYIFHGNSAPDNAAVDGRGAWSTLRPGHGVGFTSNGTENQYSNRFGAELTFARTLRELYPDRRIAIIKYSRGGTSIHADAAGNFGCWEPDYRGADGVNQYDHFLAAVSAAHADTDIDNDGTADRLIPAGIVWMQGESDAHHSQEIADAYQSNLDRLMDLIRASLRADDLPVVIGEISDSKVDPEIWKFGDTVRAAQTAWVDGDEAAAIVTETGQYGYSDPWHYDSAGYIDLGERFAKALAEIGDDQ
jgi:hypothetical protein